jgi:hypothetical protein
MRSNASAVAKKGLARPAEHEERPERDDQCRGDLVEQLAVGREARSEQRRANA